MNTNGVLRGTGVRRTQSPSARQRIRQSLEDERDLSDAAWFLGQLGSRKPPNIQRHNSREDGRYGTDIIANSGKTYLFDHRGKLYIKPEGRSSFDIVSNNPGRTPPSLETGGRQNPNRKVLIFGDGSKLVYVLEAHGNWGVRHIPPPLTKRMLLDSAGRDGSPAEQIPKHHAGRAPNPYAG
jgi:hypothetical protein